MARKTRPARQPRGRPTVARVGPRPEAPSRRPDTVPLASLQHPGRIPIGTMPTARHRAEKADSGQPQGAMNACDEAGSSEDTPLLPQPAPQLEQPAPRPTTSNRSRDDAMKKLWASEEGRARVLSLASEKPERTLMRGALGALGVSGLSASLPKDPTRALAVLYLLNRKFGLDVCVSLT